jgi:hypothetical protein
LMPTIDQLATATSASDSDEFVISQGGIARKISRAQILNGVQGKLAVPAGALLGGVGTGFVAPQAITVGQNLCLNGSTLSATAAPFAINILPEGSVPSAADLIPVCQGGKAVGITYGQLVSGISEIGNINISQAVVTPTGEVNGQTLGQLAANMLPRLGGTVTGSLILTNSPSAPNQAATKYYVDQRVATMLPLSGGSMFGSLSLAAGPHDPTHAITKQYADGLAASMLPTGGGTLSGPLLLSGDPTKPLEASTKHYSDSKLARTGDTVAGAFGLAADPISPMHAATKNYVDVQLSFSLPRLGGTLLGMLSLAADPMSGAHAATKQYVDQRVLRSGDTFTGPLLLAADPVLGLQAATKSYVDGRSASLVARAGGSLTGPLVLAADPTGHFEAATKQYVDLHVMRNGDTLTGPLLLAGNPNVPTEAATKQYVDDTLSGSITSNGGSFIGPVLLASDPLKATQAATKQYVDLKVSRAGDSMTGALALATDPVLPVQAATKNYVDTQILTALPRTGGSLTGVLILDADPISSAQAATKSYVDKQVSMALPLTGGTLSGMISLSGSPTAGSHGATKQYVDSQISTTLSRSGGTLGGPLTLSSPPIAPLQAATKSYVDANPNSERVVNVMLPPYGAKIDGATDDTAAFAAAYQAAAPGTTIYVPNGSTILKQPTTWGVALTKKVKWIVDGTTLADGTPLAAGVPTGGAPVSFVLPGLVSGHTSSSVTTSLGSSQATDFAVSQSSYIVNHAGGQNGAVIANVRADTIIYSSPGNYVWGGLDRLVWAGTQTPSAATAAQHVGRYIQTLRQSATKDAGGRFLPQPQLWAACIEYRDTTGQPSSATNASLTVEMDWFGNGPDDGNYRTIQSLVIGQHDQSGAPVEVANIIGVYLGDKSSGSAKTVFGIGVPFSNAVLDTTFARQINDAPVIKMSAGQAIAFDSSGQNRLSFESSSGTLRWHQGDLSYAVGKGISVGWVNVYSSSATLYNYQSGNFIILAGNTPYSITLPAANTVGAGTGFSFSVTGSATVNLLTSLSDRIDSGPIVLRPNDRYHIVSDGSGFWHEVFWTNAVSPRFSGPIVLPSFQVGSLPVGSPAGSKAFAANGRKPNEVAGMGSGVEVFFDGQHWISCCSGSIVVT